MDNNLGEDPAFDHDYDGITVSVSGLFDAWQAWERLSCPPTSGGWLDQPLPLLARFGIMNLVRFTWENYRQPEYDWSNFTPTQLDLIAWLEEEDG